MNKLLTVGLVMVSLTCNLALAQTTSSAKTSKPGDETHENAMQRYMREACEEDPKACKKWRQKARELREARQAEQRAAQPPGAEEPSNKVSATVDAAQ